MGQKKCPDYRGVLIPEVEMYTSTVLGEGKRVLFREVSLIRGVLFREVPLCIHMHVYYKYGLRIQLKCFTVVSLEFHS